MVIYAINPPINIRLKKVITKNHVEVWAALQVLLEGLHKNRAMPNRIYQAKNSLSTTATGNSGEKNNPTQNKVWLYMICIVFQAISNSREVFFVKNLKKNIHYQFLENY